MTAIYLRHVKRYEIMKVNSCHIPPLYAHSVSSIAPYVAYFVHSVPLRSAYGEGEREERTKPEPDGERSGRRDQPVRS